MRLAIVRLDKNLIVIVITCDSTIVYNIVTITIVTMTIEYRKYSIGNIAIIVQSNKFDLYSIWILNRLKSKH